MKWPLPLADTFNHTAMKLLRLSQTNLASTTTLTATTNPPFGYPMWA